MPMRRTTSPAPSQPRSRRSPSPDGRAASSEDEGRRRADGTSGRNGKRPSAPGSILLGMDGSLFSSINRFADRTVWAHGFMKFYASNGVVLFALLLLFGYLLARHRSDVSGVASSLWAGGAVLVALGVAQLIGNIVDRARPYDTLANVHVLVQKTTDFSFPSDHATVVGAVAVG